MCCPQNYTSAPHCLEALQELYNHIHRYYDQVRPGLSRGRDPSLGAEEVSRPNPAGRGEEGPGLRRSLVSVQLPQGRPRAAPTGSPAPAEMEAGLSGPGPVGRGLEAQAGHPSLPWQIISALEEDPVGQKMQLACRLQQIAALVENKVTDL